ncbi:MAG: dTDP-4-amino-4,6-dideoxygalactose transaminase [Rhodothermales bacterium]|jgi:dTDP-4-amino-4,6-dideoxygalactose transaminase
MNVPLLDLKAQYRGLREEIRAAIDEVCDAQYFILGPTVNRFESDVAAYSQVPHACGVSSGSDALLIALMAEGIGPGDEVITTTYTFFATAGAVSRLGATPVFVDVEPDTLNIDVDAVAAAITPATRAIIPVHLFGQMADMDPIMALAETHDLIVIEDAAQAIGAHYKGRPAGSIGHYGCFSFFPSKNLGGFGDGGMVTTTSDERIDRLRWYRNHGANPKYYHSFVGGNFRLDAIQAAVLSIKLRHLDDWHRGRQENADTYRKLFAEHDPDGRIGLPVAAETSTRHIYNQFCLRVPQRRDAVWDGLKAAGVGSEVYYPVPLHLQRCFADLGYKQGDCPHAELAANEALAIPIYPELTDAQLSYVVEQVTQL